MIMTMKLITSGQSNYRHINAAGNAIASVKVKVTSCIAVRANASSLRELTCHMRSHSVTRHPAEVTFPPLPQPKLVLDLATPEGCKAEFTWEPAGGVWELKQQMCDLSSH